MKKKKKKKSKIKEKVIIQARGNSESKYRWSSYPLGGMVDGAAAIPVYLTN